MERDVCDAARPETVRKHNDFVEITDINDDVLSEQYHSACVGVPGCRLVLLSGKWLYIYVPFIIICNICHLFYNLLF